MDTGLNAPELPRPAYRALGAFRLLLALLVVVQHFQYLLPFADAWPFRRWGLGIVAVDVFFVISGLVITEAIVQVYRGRPLRFLANRLLRLIPPYLAALALSVAVHAWLWRSGQLRVWDFALDGSPVTMGHVVTGILELLPGGRSIQLAAGFEFIPFAWTLRVEMTFYLVAFAVAVVVAQPRWRARRPIWRVGAGASALGFALLMFLLFLIRRRPLILGNIPFFVLGFALYWRDRDPRAWSRALVGLAALGGLAALFALRSPRFPWHTGEQAVLLAALGVGLSALLRAEGLGSRLRGLDRAAGDLSYPLYLNHYAVGIAWYDRCAARGWGVFIAAMACSLVTAWVMMLLVESPMRSLRNRVRGVRL
jgi:peptidoglycan/LPS O-acetylase OafA/YrhL